MGVVMPSLAIEYEICDQLVAFNRKNIISDKVKNFFKKICSLMDVNIN